MDKQRCYFVIDMKSFFASVECAERGLDAMSTNLIVADESRTDATICLAVSPSMKKLGVKNRCRLFEVPKNLKYIIAPPRMKKYIEYASEIYGIYLQYIDKSDIHVYSIDECILDVTDYLKIYNIRAKDFAKKLMKEIENKLGIPSTVGIGTNMYLAKIALDLTAKHSPERIGWLSEDKFKRELWNYRPITDFWGISTGISNRLAKYAIYDMEGITKINEEYLYKEFGINAELLIDHAYGKESCLMSDIKNYRGKSKSISNSQILSCNYNFSDARVVITEMVQEGCYRLADENLITSHLNLIVGYGDDRTYIKGSKRLKFSTNLFSQIAPVIGKLFDDIVDSTRPIRKLMYSFEGLVSDQYEEFDFFTDIEKTQKEKSLVKKMIQIRNKYGKNAILRGIDYLPNATQRERNCQIGGHKSGEV